MILNGFQKNHFFQNRYVALETPSRLPPPFMANTIINFHFDFLNPSLMSGVCKFQGYISPFLEPPADPVKYPVFQIVPITGPNTVKPAVVSLPLCRIKKAEKAIGVKFANLCCFWG